MISPKEALQRVQMEDLGLVTKLIAIIEEKITRIYDGENDDTVLIEIPTEIAQKPRVLNKVATQISRVGWFVYQAHSNTFRNEDDLSWIVSDKRKDYPHRTLIGR